MFGTVLYTIGRSAVHSGRGRRSPLAGAAVLAGCSRNSAVPNTWPMSAAPA
jgi:hypothetical protein